jgi:hypothetical protein
MTLEAEIKKLERQIKRAEMEMDKEKQAYEAIIAKRKERIEKRRLYLKLLKKELKNQ